MYAITDKEIQDDWGYAWDCLVDACWDNKELHEILEKLDEVAESNKIALIRELADNIFSDSATRLVAMWGFEDTPARDEIYLSFEAKMDLLKPYLEKYLNATH